MPSIDCNSHRSSSIVIDVMPRLPHHPGFSGKFTDPSYLFSRSPYQLQRINVFKVSVSVPFHLIDICRCSLDVATLTAGFIDPMESFGDVSRWLCDAGMSTVSGFALSHLIDTYALDLQSSVFAPMLPWHTGLEGKFLCPSYSLYRSPQ